MSGLFTHIKSFGLLLQGTQTLACTKVRGESLKISFAPPRGKPNLTSQQSGCGGLCEERSRDATSAGKPVQSDPVPPGAGLHQESGPCPGPSSCSSIG